MQRNVAANALDDVARVRCLDFEFATPEDPGRCAEGGGPKYSRLGTQACSPAANPWLCPADAAARDYGWQPEDCAELRGMQVILAAEVIYDNDLTLAFMQSMERFLQPSSPSSTGEGFYCKKKPMILAFAACSHTRSSFNTQCSSLFLRPATL